MRVSLDKFNGHATLIIVVPAQQSTIDQSLPPQNFLAPSGSGDIPHVHVQLVTVPVAHVMCINFPGLIVWSRISQFPQEHYRSYQQSMHTGHGFSNKICSHFFSFW